MSSDKKRAPNSAQVYQDVRDAITRFHVLGTLKDNQKLWMFGNGTFVADDYRFSSLWRKLYRQSRIEILSLISRDTTLLMERYWTNPLIPPACKAAIEGLTKLEKVYDDQQIVIRSLIERLREPAQPSK